MSQTTSQTCAYEYTVRRGDSFYLIAHRLGVPLKDLLEANSDINPARLMVGDVLCIPGAAAETPDTNITAPTTPDASDTTTDDALDTPAADMNAPATPGGETPDISFCPEIDRYTVLQGETAADVQLKKDVTHFPMMYISKGGVRFEKEAHDNKGKTQTHGGNRRTERAAPQGICGAKENTRKEAA